MTYLLNWIGLLSYDTLKMLESILQTNLLLLLELKTEVWTLTFLFVIFFGRDVTKYRVILKLYIAFQVSLFNKWRVFQVLNIDLAHGRYTKMVVVFLIVVVIVAVMLTWAAVILLNLSTHFAFTLCCGWAGTVDLTQAVSSFWKICPFLLVNFNTSFSFQIKCCFWRIPSLIT